MTRDELLHRLQTIKAQGNLALALLEATPQTAATKEGARTITMWLKNELQNEFLRSLQGDAQNSMTIFELSVYGPTIEEAWRRSGISRLKLERAPTKKWIETIEAVVYTAGKYVS